MSTGDGSSKRDIRRHGRIPFAGRIGIAWDDGSGNPKFMLAKCLDLSEGGLRVEAPQSIPARTPVSLRAEGIQFSGNASVKHQRRQGSNYVLGLELSEALRDKVLAAIRKRG